MRTSLLLTLAFFGCGGAADPGEFVDSGSEVDATIRDASAPERDSATPDDAGMVSCEGLRPDLGTSIQLARGLVIARDGTMYFSWPGGAGRMPPGGAVDTGWLTIAGVSTTAGLALDAANETLFIVVPDPDDVDAPSIYRVAIASEEATPLVTGGFPYALAIGPDGMLYYSDIADSSIRRVDPAGGTSTRVTTSELASPKGIAFEAGGTLLVASGYPGSIVRLTLSTTGGETAREPVGGGLPSPEAFALDAVGRIYVTSSFGGVLWRMNADGSDRVTLASMLNSPFFLDFGHGALCRTDLYITGASAVMRFENDTLGADVPWQ